jgi:alpha-ketoglutarate-dependent taurine dioxygenase
MMMRTLSQLQLPSAWFADLSAAGWYSFNLADRLGGPDAVSNEVLRALADRLTAVAPGLSSSGVTYVQEVSDTPYVTWTRSDVPFHNDSLFLCKPPHYILLYCDLAATEGGETLVTRADDASRQLSPALREVLERVRVRVRQGDLCFTRSLLTRHPLDGSEVLLFWDPGMSTDSSLEVLGETGDTDVVGQLRQLLRGAEVHRHAWRQGDLLILDNFKVLHARTAFSGCRRLRRLLVGPHASSWK